MLFGERFTSDMSVSTSIDYLVYKCYNPTSFAHFNLRR